MTDACSDGCRTPVAVAADRRSVLVRRVRLLVSATIAYNLVEAAVALRAGCRSSRWPPT